MYRLMICVVFVVLSLTTVNAIRCYKGITGWNLDEVDCSIWGPDSNETSWFNHSVTSPYFKPLETCMKKVSGIGTLRHQYRVLFVLLLL